ncbi:Ribosomal protein S18 acetylase RimI [Pseudomonas pohangensis]|jgi:GNAT superfamily N-acetyltransferase|uniref:Ribosomal protein S18 acetylase RimI n=1 Tax=Pseudomonas pohangensis TaxID=364197 RepID=A0A1H2FPW2_9PSED|nr:GNAT family N-acetyltransferase [Pseudomonas pohangensis]SDU09379.1 Ribosomal protein S18 acetylase RimI [Pseudomonas pohangensis]
MKDQPYRFSLGADAGARDVVFRQLEHFNLQQVGDLIYEDFQLYARNASDEVVGGMFGHSGLGWLYIDYFWVQDDQRSKGLGQQLLRQAEELALARGCSGVFLYTYSFQAPGFYRKQGYQLMGVLEDCPPGHQRFYLKKRLEQ